MILVAPDGFKGSLTAREAAEAIARGLARAFPDTELCLLPLTDGGEGFLEVLVAASGARLERHVTTNAVGEPIEAEVAVLEAQDTLAVELSSAAGLAQLAPARRDPLLTTTYGVGQLIASAYARRPFSRLLLALGGSATADGGAGLLEALGVRLLDAEGKALPRGGGALTRLASLDLTHLHPALRAEVTVAVDVDNPLVGPRGSARVYAPQKGAGAAAVEQLEAGLTRFADVLEAATGQRLHDHPGTGSAGGVPAGLVAMAHATLTPGFELAAKALGLDEAIARADLVVTGEGQLDDQSFDGKVVGRLARRCQAAGVPLLVLAGRLDPAGEALLTRHGGAALSLAPGPLTLEAATSQAPALLEAAAARAGGLLQLLRRP